MKSTSLIYHQFLKRIHAVRKKEKLHSLLSGVFLFVAITITALFLALILNSMFQINSSGRAIICGVLFVVTLISFGFWIVRPLFSVFFRKNNPSHFDIAQRIGFHFPNIKDRLINALQVFYYFNQHKEGYSLQLTEAALEKANRETGNIDFLSIVSKEPLIRKLKYAVISIVLVIIIFSTFTAPIKQSAYYLFNPFEKYQNKILYTFAINPGDTEVLKNDNVPIEVTGYGILPEQITLNIHDVINGYSYEKKMTVEDSNHYHHTIESIKDSAEYFITTNEFKSETFLISVIELPLVRNLQIKLNYPKYSKIEHRYQDENVGDISALKGTVAEINITANKKLDGAILNFDSDKQKKLAVTSNRARGDFVISGDDEYYISLSDMSGRSNKDPIKYRISIIEDNYPTIKIVTPGVDVDISEEMLLRMVIEGEDDFGFSGLQLVYKILRGGTETKENYNFIPLKLKQYDSEKFRLNYDWNLKELFLLPEDMVSYFAEVFDNDDVSGPKSTKSQTYVIRFPSIYEIYTEVKNEHNETFETFEGMYQKSKELKEHISELVQEMKKDANLDWEEKKKLEDIVASQQQLQQNLEEIDKTLEEMIERMEKNDLASLETLKKYQELQQLLRELMTEEMKEAMKKLQKAMENVDPEELKKAVENLDINQEEFLKNLEKSIELLKRLQIEQKMDEVLKRAEELLERQDEILERARNDNLENRNELAKQQQDAQKRTEELKKELENLEANMGEFEDMPQEQLNAASELMDREKIAQNMKQASENFQKGKMDNAKNFSQQAKNSLAELTEMLNNARKDLLQSQKQQVMAELKHLSHDLLALSKSQEDVLNDGKQLSKSSPQVEHIAEQQQYLINGLGRVTERSGNLSKKTLFVSSQMGKTLGQSMHEMQTALQNLEERNNSSATRNQAKAMNSLNKAVIQVQKSMQSLAASSSSTGMQEMFNQLSKMSGKQKGINQQTMQMGMNGKLSLQQQAAMARLAAEQGALRKSMEQLNREFGDRSDLLGRLDNVAQDMEDVVKDLQNRNVNQKTINKQRQILSRLLDAQKSVHKREFSKKRQAETGKYYLAKSPDDLPENMGEIDSQIREDLLKALKQGYSRDYQELIKKYFEALVNEEIN